MLPLSYSASKLAAVVAAFSILSPLSSWRVSSATRIYDLGSLIVSHMSRPVSCVLLCMALVLFWDSPFELGISKVVDGHQDPQSSRSLPLKKVGDEAVHKELGDRMERAATTASSIEAEQDCGSGPRCQDTIMVDVDAQTRFEITSKQSNDLPLSRGYTLGSREDIYINDAKLLLMLLDLVNAVRHMLMLPVQVPAAEESDGFAEIIDFLKASSVHYALIVNPIIYTSCIEQFFPPKLRVFSINHIPSGLKYNGYEICYIDVFWPCGGSIDDLEVFGLSLEVDLGTVSRSIEKRSCDELDGFVSIPDEGDMAFLRKKVKSGAAVGKHVFLQVHV
ncbi:hypothetical protein Tco_0175201 [Tanacetum coccineum]